MKKICYFDEEKKKLNDECNVRNFKWFFFWINSKSTFLQATLSDFELMNNNGDGLSNSKYLLITPPGVGPTLKVYIFTHTKKKPIYDKDFLLQNW